MSPLLPEAFCHQLFYVALLLQYSTEREVLCKKYKQNQLCFQSNKFEWPLVYVFLSCFCLGCTSCGSTDKTKFCIFHSAYKYTLSVCSIWYSILKWYSFKAPRNLADGVGFEACPCIVINVSLRTFLSLSLSLILHPSYHAGIWFRYFCNLRLMRIPGV